MKQRILGELEKIEEAHNVKIVYACESGSRGWGFPSSDSDYDIRFLYLHPRDWYLSIDLEKKRDVIELPLIDTLDISGWDLRKALKLFRKSNPHLLEWLGSPIVYQEKFSTVKRLRDLTPVFYNRVACMYHYLHMARGNNREYLAGDRVWIKKYFYVLRPILAVNWLEKDIGVIPTEFDILVRNVVESAVLREKIEQMVVDKKAGYELGYGPRIPEISDFINSELDRLEGMKFEGRMVRQPVDDLDIVFRSTLSEVWD